MAALIGLRDLTPEGPQEIDWGHPCAQGLADYVLLNRAGPLYNLATRRYSDHFNGSTPGTFIGGRGHRFNGTTDGRGFSGSVFSEIREGTIGCGFAHQTAALDRRLLGHGSTAANEPLVTLGTRQQTSSTGLAFVLRDSAGMVSTLQQAGSFPVSNDGSHQNVVCRFRMGDFQDIWQNGMLERAQIASGGGAPMGTNAWAVGAIARAGVVTPIAADIFWAANWDRVIADDVAAWMSAEPYALLRRVRRRIYHVAAGSIAATVMPGDCAQAQSAEFGTLQQVHALLPDGAVSMQNAEAGLAATGAVIAVSGAVQEQAAENVPVQQNHAVSGTDAAQGQFSGTVFITRDGIEAPERRRLHIHAERRRRIVERLQSIVKPEKG